MRDAPKAGASLFFYREFLLFFLIKLSIFAEKGNYAFTIPVTLTVMCSWRLKNIPLYVGISG